MALSFLSSAYVNNSLMSFDQLMKLITNRHTVSTVMVESGSSDVFRGLELGMRFNGRCKKLPFPAASGDA